MQSIISDVQVLDWISLRIRRGNVLVLLDGLDEVPHEKRLHLASDRGLLADIVRRFDNEDARLVLTCRDSVYGELSGHLSELRLASESEGFVSLELKPFTRERITEYAHRFFGDEVTGDLFLKDIVDPRGGAARYTHLAEEPLYLHMLCWLWAGSEIPSRAGRKRDA